MPKSADEVMSGDNPALVALVREAIDDAGGSISFAEYMDLALFAPDLGYYSASATQFGADGDFVTAPESSPLFAHSVARQSAEILARLGGGEIIEVGAGSGALAVDLLESLADMESLPRHYSIIERSQRLRDRQRESIASCLPNVASRVRWREELPRDFRGVLLANEVLDAMPAHRFRVHRDGVRELRVGWGDGSFCWFESARSDSTLDRYIESVLQTLDHPLADGYESECAPLRQDWVTQIGACLTEGAALLFDYGYGRAEYYHPQRVKGTLRCFHRHRAHDDPLVMPGLQDISVHVDFTAVAEAAAAAGLEVAGYTTQAEFLIATGLLEVCRNVDPGSRRYVELTAQIKRLTLPGEMGEAIKVLALTRELDGSLVGFSGRDLSGRL